MSYLALDYPSYTNGSFSNLTNNYGYLLLTSNSSLTFHKNTNCEILVIGAGGRGGIGSYSGGGGAGEVIYQPSLSFVSGVYNIQIGIDNLITSNRISKITSGGNEIIKANGGGDGAFYILKQEKINNTYELLNSIIMINNKTSLLLSGIYTITENQGLISINNVINNTYPDINGFLSYYWFKFNGNKNDSGTATTLLTLTETGTIIYNSYDVSLSFNNYLNFPNGNYIYTIANSGNITITFWFKGITENDCDIYLFNFIDNTQGSNTAGGSFYYYFYITYYKNISGVETLDFRIRNSSSGGVSYIYTATEPLMNNNWRFISWNVSSGGLWYIFLDNINLVNGTITKGIANVTYNENNIGKRSRFSTRISTYNINIKDFRFYNVGLNTSNEIKDLYIGKYILYNNIFSNGNGGFGYWDASTLDINRRFPSKIYNALGIKQYQTSSLNGRTCSKNSFTLNTSNISYGAGIYEIWYSSDYATTSTTYDPHLLFNQNNTESGTHFLNNNYTATTGDLTTQGNNYYFFEDYKGDWIAIKLPIPIAITSYSIAQRTTNTATISRAPKNYRIYASMDGINWIILITISNATYSSGIHTNTSLSSNTTPYLYYCLSINALLGGDTGSVVLNFNEWIINGKQIIVSDNNNRGSGGGGYGNNYLFQFGSIAGTPFNNYSLINNGYDGTTNQGGNGGSASSLYLSNIIKDNSIITLNDNFYSYSINYQANQNLNQGTYSANFIDGLITFNSINDKSYPILINNNLLVWYKFDSGSLLTDSSGNSYTLTNNNSVSLDNIDYIKGNSSITLNGTNQNLTGAYFNLNNLSFSVCFWFKRTSNGRNDFIFRLGSTATLRTQVHFGYRDVNTIRFGFMSGDELQTSSTYLDAGYWVHLVATFDSTSLSRKIYRNGVEIASNIAGGQLNTDNNLIIGSYHNGTSAFYCSGKVDDFRLYNKSLSLEEVQEIYKGRISIYYKYYQGLTLQNSLVGSGGTGATSSSTPIIKTNYGDGGDANGGLGFQGAIIIKFPFENNIGNSNFSSNLFLLNDKIIEFTSWNDINQKPSFCNICFSANYNDISNKPNLSLLSTNSNLYYSSNSFYSSFSNLNYSNSNNLLTFANNKLNNLNSSLWGNVGNNIYSNLGSIGIGTSSFGNNKLIIQGNLKSDDFKIKGIGFSNLLITSNILDNKSNILYTSISNQDFISKNKQITSSQFTTDASKNLFINYFSNYYQSSYSILSTCNSLVLSKNSSLTFNYTNQISINSGTYNILFNNGSITFGNLNPDKSYPILSNLNPVIWYKFDDSSNNMIFENSLNPSSNLILFNNPSFDNVNFVKGNGSIYLNNPSTASTQIYATIPTNVLPASYLNSLNVANGLSFSFWIKLSSSSIDYGRILYFGNFQVASPYYDNTNYRLQIRTSSPKTSAIYFDIVKDGLYSFQYNADMYDDNWKHIIWTISPSGVWNIYVNNSLVCNNQSKFVFPLLSATNLIYILGVDKHPSNYGMIGNFDDFRIYDSVLTSNQVQELYNGRIDIFSSSKYTSNIGIGTSSNLGNDLLLIYGNMNIDDFKIKGTSSSNLLITSNILDNSSNYLIQNFNSNFDKYHSSNWINSTNSSIYITSNLGIGSTIPYEKLDIYGNIGISGAILPNSCNSFDLGSSNKKWKDLYITGNSIYLNDFIIKNSNNYLSISNIDLSHINFFNNLNTNSNKISLNTQGDFMINNKYLLGIDKNLYSSNIVFSNVLSNSSNSLFDLNNSKFNSSNSTDLIQISNKRFITNDIYNRPATFTGILECYNLTTSNLNVIGDYTNFNTTIYQTEQLFVENSCNYPAMSIKQMNINKNVAEFYNSNYSIANVSVSGTGNSINIASDNSNYKYALFTSNGTFIVDKNISCDILIVGGGGGGGTGGGGGGAGAVLYTTNFNISSGTYSIIVGNGGSGSSSSSSNGFNGSNSSININGIDYIAVGGGGGGTRNDSASYIGRAGNNGGSGGGGSHSDTSTIVNIGGSSTKNIYSGWTSLGNAGGEGKDGTSGGYGSGGGGGAGSIGANAGTNSGGNGGSGINLTSIFGTAVGNSGWFAGGGGGGSYTGTGGYGNGGSGLLGGGGNAYGSNGLANTGGGGGGANFGASTGGSGGSGVVIIRYSIKNPEIQMKCLVNSNGNVGIGTINPLSKLDVIGSINSTGLIVNNNEIINQIKINDSNYSNSIYNSWNYSNNLFNSLSNSFENIKNSKQDLLNSSTILLGIGSSLTNINYLNLINKPDLSIYSTSVNSTSNSLYSNLSNLDFYSSNSNISYLNNETNNLVKFLWNTNGNNNGNANGNDNGNNVFTNSNVGIGSFIPAYSLDIDGNLNTNELLIKKGNISNIFITSNIFDIKSNNHYSSLSNLDYYSSNSNIIYVNNIVNTAIANYNNYLDNVDLWKTNGNSKVYINSNINILDNIFSLGIGSLSTSITSTCNSLVLSQNSIIKYNNTNETNINSGTYNIVFNNGSITFGSLNPDKSYPILSNLNPVAWYKFDDNTNLGIDNSGNNYNLTNTLVTINSINYIKGTGSADLDGSTNYFTSTNSTLASYLNQKSFSISFWLYPKSNTLGFTFSVGANSSGRFWFGYGTQASGIYEFSFVTTTLASSVFNDANTWVFLTFTYNYQNSLKTIYRNGISIATETEVAPLLTNNTILIGRILNTSSYKGNGLIDDFRIYNQVLTSNQVQELYNGRIDIYNLNNNNSSNLLIKGDMNINGNIKFKNIPIINNQPLFNGAINYSNIRNRPYLLDILTSSNIINVGSSNNLNFPLSITSWKNEWFLFIGTSPTNVPNSFIFHHITPTINSKWWFNGTTSTTIAEISDERVKKNINDLSNGIDKLMLLNPKEYFLCDEKDYHKKYGIIAQDVFQIPELSHLVHKDIDFIANIYSSGSYDNSNGMFIITSSKIIDGLIEINDELKILLENQDNQEIIIEELPYENRYKKRFVKVKGIIDNYSFEIFDDIELNEFEKSNLFIYGKKINDFLKLDYSSLYTLNIKANQEIYHIINNSYNILNNLTSRIKNLEDKSS